MTCGPACRRASKAAASGAWFREQVGNPDLTFSGAGAEQAPWVVLDPTPDGDLGMYGPLVLPERWGEEGYQPGRLLRRTKTPEGVEEVPAGEAREEGHQLQSASASARTAEEPT